MSQRKRPLSSNPQSDSIFLGTPSSALSEFAPVWKQEARDERGRKRFHGAFTGGFSAGYFNTVGSKEGNILMKLLLGAFGLIANTSS